MADQSRKEELIRELDYARNRASENRRALSEDLRFGDKLKSSLARFRGVWLTGAILTGLVIAKLPARTKKVKVVVPRGSRGEREMKKAGQAGIAMVVFKFVFDIVKPFLMSWLTKRVKSGRLW